MKTIGLFFSICLTLTSAIAKAQAFREEAIYQGVEYVVLVSEESQALVDLFYIDQEGWPQLISSSSESNISAAKVSAKNILTQVKAGVFHRSIPTRQDYLPNQLNEIWTTKNTWSDAWEQKYAEWVRTETGPKFFTKYGIATDCADVAYALRWIFSRIHFLPAASTLGATGKLVTNESGNSVWAGLPTSTNWWQDQRFRRALNYVLVNVYTHTLFKDSYSIAINRDSLFEGAYHVSIFEGTGHTQVVSETHYGEDDQIPFLIMQSTTPRQVRELTVVMPWMQKSEKAKRAFLRMRWSVKSAQGSISLLPQEQHLGFSQEQYEASFTDGYGSMLMAVYRRLSPNFTLTIAARRTILDLENSLLERNQIVEDGYAACRSNSCPEGSALYEAWSTSSRDKRITERLYLLEQLAGNASMADDDLTFEEIKKMKDALFSKPFVVPGIATVPVSRVIWAIQKDLSSFDPRSIPKARWAVEPAGVVEAFTLQLEKLLASRAKKIQEAAGKCPTRAACPFKSELFKSLNTKNEDGGVVSLIGVVEGLNSEVCQLYPADCSEVQSLASTKTFQFASQKVGFGNLLKRAINFQSSPGQPLAERWGVVPLPIHRILSSGKIAENKIDMADLNVGEVETSTITSLRSGKSVTLPGWRLLDIFASKAVLSKNLASGTRIQIYNFSTNQSDEFDLALDVKSGFVTKNGSITLASKNELISYKVNGGQLVRVWGQAQASDSNDIGIDRENDLIYFISGAEKILLRTGRSDLEVKIPLSTTPGFEFSMLKCVDQICVFYPGIIMDIQSSSGYVLDLRNSVSLKVQGLGDIAKLGSTFFISQLVDVVSREYRVLALNSDLSFGREILRKSKLQNLRFVKEGIVTQSQDSVSIFDWSNSGLVERSIAVKASYVSSTDNFLLIQLSSGGVTLVSRKDLKQISLPDVGFASVIEGNNRAFFQIYDVDPSFYVQLFEIKNGQLVPFFDNMTFNSLLDDFAIGRVNGWPAIFKP